MVIEIKAVTAERPRIKALIYGPPGSGKTTLAATASKHPEMEKVLFADIDKGLLSVASVGGLGYADINNLGELEELQAMIAGNAEALNGVQTLVIDSLSELFDNYMREIAQKAAASDKKRDPDVNEIQDYGHATSRISRVVRWCRELPLHVIATAHDKVDKRPVDARKKSKHDAEILGVYPKFPAKLGTAIMGTFDFVWYLAVDSDGTRNMLTQPSGAYQAKTRGQTFAKELGQIVKEPNIAEIYTLLLNTEGMKG